jgi:hypothetical protein
MSDIIARRDTRRPGWRQAKSDGAWRASASLTALAVANARPVRAHPILSLNPHAAGRGACWPRVGSGQGRASARARRVSAPRRSPLPTKRGAAVALGRAYARAPSGQGGAPGQMRPRGRRTTLFAAGEVPSLLFSLRHLGREHKKHPPDPVLWRRLAEPAARTHGVPLRCAQAARIGRRFGANRRMNTDSIRWDPATETIAGDPEAIARLSCAYRSPWTLPAS